MLGIVANPAVATTATGGATPHVTVSLDKHCGICGSEDHTTHACSLPLVIPPDFPIEWPRTARFMSHPGCQSEHTERQSRQVNPFSHVIPPPPSTPPPCPPSTSRSSSTQPSMMHSLFGSTSDITDMSQSASRPLASEPPTLRSLFGSTFPTSLTCHRTLLRISLNINVI